MSAKPKLTSQIVEDTAREVARDYPERTNPLGYNMDGAGEGGIGLPCQYTYADGSHCLAGEVLTRLGLEDALPTEEGDDRQVAPVQNVVLRLVVEGAVSIPSRDSATDVIQICWDLTMLQRMADDETPWAEAVMDYYTPEIAKYRQPSETFADGVMELWQELSEVYA